jgi:type 1 glutamine amidotransferase
VIADDHARPLAAWVSNGGALLGLHGATVSGQTSAEFRRLIGGVFVEHPEPFEFIVQPVRVSAFEGLETFSVHDEFYIEQCEDDVVVRMVGIHENMDYPLVWTREEGRGRVAHIAMGHDEKVWSLPAYRRLLKATLAWLLEHRR